MQAKHLSHRPGMVVDGDPVRLHSTCAAVQNAGFEVIRTFNAREALRECRSREGGLSFLVTADDLRDMAPLQLANLIDRILPELPVLVLTSGGMLYVPEHRSLVWKCVPASHNHQELTDVLTRLKSLPG